LADRVSNLNRADVARLRQNIGDGQHAKRFVVANAVPRHVNLAILAIEDFFGADKVLVKAAASVISLNVEPGS
jgi:hypothetical protein